MTSRAIIILGPGQSPDGTMLPLGNSRIDLAYQKFLNAQPSLCLPYVILSGGRKAHFNSEASAMRDFIERHHPDMLKSLLLEELSTDTLQNAFFTKVIHVDPLGIKQLSVITNSFHMARTKQIFTNLFDASYEFEFLEAADPEVSSSVVANYKFIEESLIDFNEKTLFCKDINKNLKTIHSLIFGLAPNLAAAYGALIKNLQPYFIQNKS